MPCHGLLAVKVPVNVPAGTATPSMLVTVMSVPLAVNTAQCPVLVPAIQVPLVCADVIVVCCAPTTRPMPSPPVRPSFRSITSTFCPAELKPIAVPTSVVPSITCHRPLPRDTRVPLRPPAGQAPALRSALGHDCQVPLLAIKMG